MDVLDQGSCFFSSAHFCTISAVGLGCSADVAGLFPLWSLILIQGEVARGCMVLLVESSQYAKKKNLVGNSIFYAHSLPSFRS